MDTKSETTKRIILNKDSIKALMYTLPVNGHYTYHITDHDAECFADMLMDLVHQEVIRGKIEECSHMRTYYDSKLSIRQYLIKRIADLQRQIKEQS